MVASNFGRSEMNLALIAFIALMDRNVKEIS